MIEDHQKYQELNNYLKEKDSVLIIKIHPIQDLTLLRISDMSNIRVITADRARALRLDLYRLMRSADACISDYSSAAYQYLLLDRPLAFVLSDLADYTRGFSVENYEDFLPGEHINTFDDMIAFMEHVAGGEDTWREKRRELRDFLYEYQDGNACRRLAEFMGL